jgi:hypothetical protein
MEGGAPKRSNSPLGPPSAVPDGLVPILQLLVARSDAAGHTTRAPLHEECCNMLAGSPGMR